MAVDQKISGDLIVNGTVDGRDVATDGTKLDGIEALAEVNDPLTVLGPASATDNAIARWDTATGKLIQDSTAVILDSGRVNFLRDGTAQTMAEFRAPVAAQRAALELVNSAAVSASNIAAMIYRLTTTTTADKEAMRVDVSLSDTADATSTALTQFYNRDQDAMAAVMALKGANVGIGTAAPTQKLHVVKVDTGTVAALIESTFSTTQSVQQQLKSAGASSATWAWINSGNRMQFNEIANAAATPKGEALTIRATTGRVGVNDNNPDYQLDVNGTFGFTPGASVTPVDNGDVVIEATDNTTLTFKLKGSDGVVRTGTLTLA